MRCFSFMGLMLANELDIVATSAVHGHEWWISALGRIQPMSTTRPPPAPYRAVTPRMFVSNVEQTVAFLCTVFEASGQIEPGRPTDVHIGDSLVLVSSATDREHFPAFLYIYVDDADATYQRAVEAGAEVLEEPLDTPYGDRRAMFRDTFGNVYQVAHRR